IEKSFVFDFDRFFSTRKVLLIVDDTHWLDEKTLLFLQLMIDSRISNSYPVFSAIDYMMITTDDQHVANEKEYNNLFNKNNFELIETLPITVAEYATTLLKFGFKRTLKKELIQILYSITGPHLLLIKKLAEYLSQKNEQEIRLFFDEHSNENTSQLFIETLLLNKLIALGATGTQIITLLEIASVIGLSFSKDELLCLSKENEDEIKDIIKKATHAELITGHENTQSFSHEILRFFFLNRLHEKKYQYCRSFSECLAKLRPSDYKTRAKFLTDGGEINSSCIVSLLGVLKDFRDGLQLDPHIQSKIKNFPSEFDLNDFLQKMSAAYYHYFETRYDDAKTILLQIEDWLPKSLLAEKYYILSLCMSKTMIIKDLEDAKSYLQGWDELKEEEGEIWTRIMTILMMICINLYEYEDAKFIEKKIIFYLSDRIKFDPTASYSINILRRNSTAAHINEIATLRTKQSIEYFSGGSISARPVNPVQLYYSLNNHAANLIVAGSYQEAFQHSQQVLLLLNQNKILHFPEPQIPYSNYIISGMLSQKISNADALKLYNAITSYEHFAADELLIKNNYAVLHIYNNQVANALSIFEALNETFNNRDIDTYYSYWIKSNLAGIYYVNDHDEKFSVVWKDLQTLIPKIPDRIYLEKRHELLENGIGKIERNWQAWDNYLLQKFPVMIGKPWNFFSRGFLLSDIQLWYES
ncbi:MAG TPA: hypothetical protein VK787_03090, partial [Puia sp.]|nr:hypothetical protein [Puia sp.]